MMTPPADLGYIETEYRDAAQAVTEAYEDRPDPPTVRNAPPGLLADSAERLMAALWMLERDPNAAPPTSTLPTESNDIQALGHYGIQLMSDLAAWARALDLAAEHGRLQRVIFALAHWIVRRGGEIGHPDPVVDALAHVANNIKAPSELERVFIAATDFMEGMNPAISEDPDRSNPGRPWRILVLNRAIIATRSHQPHLMEQAFKSLVELLPEDAAGFFTEGMEQMDALDYPAHIRAVMEKYYQLWCRPKTLH